MPPDPQEQYEERSCTLEVQIINSNTTTRAWDGFYMGITFELP